MNGARFSVRNAIAFGWEKSIEHLWLLLKIAFTLWATAVVLGVGSEILQYLFSFSQEKLVEDGVTGAFDILGIVILIVYGIFAGVVLFQMYRLGLARVLLDIYERGTSTVNQLFCCFNLLPSYIGAAILLFLVTMAVWIPFALVNWILLQMNAPTALAVITGIGFLITIVFVVVRLGYFLYALVDKRLGATNALRYSWEITKGAVLRLIGLEILLMLIPVGLIILAIVDGVALVAAVREGWTLTAVVPAILLAVILFFLALVVPMIMLARVSAYKQLSKGPDVPMQTRTM